MRYLDVCAGMSASTLAWKPLGWRAVAYSEVEKFPCALLAHRYPETPNWGDMTKFKEWPDAAIDLLVGGTPCQSFSLAGLRKGLDDPRGSLMLTYLAIARRYRPQWLVWENVSGALSADEGRAFGTLLGGLAELGYGFAYRVLDAQYVRVDGFGRAVPQRRRRVFVVGYLGDWRRAAAVLFDAESLRGNSAPRREAGQISAPTLSTRAQGGGGLGTDFDVDGGPVAFGGNNTSGPIQAAAALNAHGGGTRRLDFESETFVVAPSAAALDASYGRLQGCSGQDANHGHSHLVAHALRGEGFDASEDGTGRGTPIVPVLAASAHPPCIAFNSREDPEVTGDRAGPLGASSPQAQAVAYDLRGRAGGAQFEGPHDTANMRAADGGSSRSYVATSWAVRRLMPIECERLQGAPDGFTAIPWRGKPAELCPDGPRYKILGNSMAVNVMRWLGQRIDMAG